MIQLRVTGARLRPGDNYQIELTPADLGIDLPPSIAAKSCGCVQPEVQERDNGWVVKVGIDIKPTSVDHQYQEQLGLKRNPKDKPSEKGGDILRVDFDFSIEQPALFKADRQSIDYANDTFQVTGLWREDFSVEGLTFSAGPDFDLIVDTQKPEVIEPSPEPVGKNYGHKGTWNVSIRAANDPPPAFCRVLVKDNQGTIRGSFGFAPKNVSFRINQSAQKLSRMADQWAGRVMLVPKSGSELKPEDLKVTCPTSEVAWSLTNGPGRIRYLMVYVKKRPQGTNVLELKIDALGTSAMAKLWFPED